MKPQLSATAPFDRKAHRVDDRAASFYRHFGFEPSPLAPRTLMIPVGAVRRTLSP